MSTAVLQLHEGDEIDTVSGAIKLVPRIDAYNVWGRLLWNDEIILFSVLPRLTVYVATVVGKNLLNVSDAPMVGDQRLILEVTKISVAVTQTVDLTLLSRLHSGGILSQKALADLREGLPFRLCPAPTSNDHSFLFPYRVNASSEIVLAQDKESIRFISHAANQHPFGESRGVIRLVLKNRGVPIAAAVVLLSFESNRRHEGELRIFGRDSTLLRSHSIFVSRLYSVKRGHLRQRHYEWLLRAITYLAPNIYAEPVSYIAGVSYDFIPAAAWAGFSVDIPQRKFGSFFYWKPVFANLARPLLSFGEVRNAYRKLRAERAGGSWLVSADRRTADTAMERGRWAIAETVANKGRWRSANPGDVMFFCVGNQFVVGAARVTATERMRIPGYERYPLGYHLTAASQLSGQIDLARIFSSEWLASLKGGGIFELPSDGYYALMEVFENARAGGRMWVRPNPYLLRRTQFTITPKKAFIVQAWELRETIYPIIKQVCEGADWAVSHSSDREGQAIFDDIWAMLNEAEAVVVDFTKRRPNVYLEYGMALVLGKPIIALTQDEGDLPSDTPNLKFKKYRGDANAYLDLQKKLPRALVDTIEDIQRANDQYDQQQAF